MEWHIDAWDARGGRAFASQRGRNVDIEQPDEVPPGPMVFIGPPSFRPEQISNIGVALSARRSGAFDRRLPLNDEQDEMQFGSADAVADFVRRAFISSSRGGGGDGGGGIPTEGGPEAPPPIHAGDAKPEVQVTESEQFLAEWMDSVQALEKDPKYLGIQLHSRRRLRIEAPPGQLAEQLASVQSGALQVLATTLDGVPWYYAKGPAFEHWQQAATTLDAALLELGLWGSWFTTPEPLRERVSDYLMYRLPKFVNEVRPRLNGISYAQMTLRWQPTSPEAVEAQKAFVASLRHAIGYADDSRLQTAAALSDRYEALLAWPLPRYARIGAKVRSVGELLATFVSSPQDIAGVRGALDIINFAAALLGSRTEDRRLEGWRERAAANWLARSVPRYVFRGDLEAVIRNLP